jgi:hypothetical protein
LRKFGLKNDAQTPLVIGRDSKSKVQTNWWFCSCRCILIHAAMVTYGPQPNGGRPGAIFDLIVEGRVAAQAATDRGPAVT